MQGAVVFDINETTLDLTPVRRAVDRLLGDQGGFSAWFQRLLQLSMTATATGAFVDFSTLAASAFRAVGATDRAGAEVRGWDEVAAAMGRLEPHADVADALARLRDQGWGLLALTNSGHATVDAQLSRVGLTEAFDHVLSVDLVGAYKPSPEPYRLAARTAGTDPGDMWMVACHDWDLAGARAVGMSTAFVRRAGMTYADAFDPPDLTVNDFAQLADALGEAG